MINHAFIEKVVLKKKMKAYPLGFKRVIVAKTK